MKVIIAGSRNIGNYKLVKRVVELSDFDITEVVSGECRGVDKLGEKWAEENGIPIKSFPANWERYGKAAGPMRNAEMAEYADSLILIWNPKVSRGSRSMYKEAQKRNLPIFEWFNENGVYYTRRMYIDDDGLRCFDLTKL